MYNAYTEEEYMQNKDNNFSQTMIVVKCLP